MEIGLLRTFIEVYRVRHFGKAAEILCITQSAVSARIHLLEERLGERLFERGRHNIQLTPAGQRLLPHAETVLNAWQRAVQEMGVHDDDRSRVPVGAEAALWNLFLGECFERVFPELTDVVFDLQTLAGESVHRRLMDGAVDMAFSYQPLLQDDVVVRDVGEIPLVMISGRRAGDADRALGSDYILVDWGGAFANLHSRAFADAPPPSLRVAHPPLALRAVQARGGAAYLPRHQVRPLLERGGVYPVADAPELKLTVYASYRRGNDHAKLLNRILQAVIAAIPGLVEP